MISAEASADLQELQGSELCQTEGKRQAFVSMHQPITGHEPLGGAWL